MRRLLQGVGKRAVVMSIELQVEIPDVEVSENLIKVSQVQRLKSGIAEKQGKGFKEMLNFCLGRFPCEMHFILCGSCKLCMMQDDENTNLFENFFLKSFTVCP